jgi:uncharacterized protein (DUF58 family)
MSSGGVASELPGSGMKWLAVAVLVVAAALLLRMGITAYALYVLVGVMAASRVLSRRWITALHVRRTCDRVTAEVGDTFSVAVVLENRGLWPVPWVLLEDVLPRQAITSRPPRLEVKGPRIMAAMLRPKARRHAAYRVTCRMRGYYQIGPSVLETGDLFGLHRRWRIAAEPQFVLVYPRLIPIRGYNLASRRPIGEVRLTHRLYEDPTRIVGCRLYEPGDPLRRVHWRATARTGTLHSKVYEPSCVAGTTLLLDFHASSYPRRHEPLCSELAVTAAASLANAVYLQGQQVGLISNGRDAADRIRLQGRQAEYRTRASAQQAAHMLDESDRLRPLIVPTRRGPEQLRRILETLARIEFTDGLTVAKLIHETSSRMPRDATVTAILPDVTDEAAWALGGLRDQGFAVTAVVIAFDEDHALDCLGRLTRQGVDARRVQNEEALAALCQQQLI